MPSKPSDGISQESGPAKIGDGRNPVLGNMLDSRSRVGETHHRSGDSASSLRRDVRPNLHAPAAGHSPGPLETGRGHADTLRHAGIGHAGKDSPLRVLPGAKADVHSSGPSGHNWQGFQHRLETGDLGRLAKGPAASQIKLADQYRLHRDGDVARRLHLNPPGAGGPHGGGPVGIAADVRLGHDHPYHGGPHSFYRGWISPSYARDCFRFHYYGPGFYTGLYWYPHWGHWVDWSWHYHCRPIWDPRPFFCRPIFYAPAVAWGYWDCPAWGALPAVSCGTWVDVPPVVVVAEQYDLQLLAVRMVDPGHPEQNEGPRFRVWFRNNSQQPVTHPFNVVLLASADGNLAAGLPQAGVRVTAIEAGETQAVDIRLPIGVYAMARDAAGEPAPYTTLHVLVDADREVSETSIANNGAAIAREEILPVDPAAFAAEPTSTAAGSEVLVAGEGFGPEPGRVLLHLGGVEMEAQILGWYDLGVRLTLPNLPLAGATPADLIVVRGDGVAANPVSITITPPVHAPEAIVPPPLPGT